jgi:two-component system, NtrC family, response regulator HydG
MLAASARERPEDVVHFARLFLAQANIEMGRRVDGFSANAQLALRRYAWPGNLRELSNTVRRMVLLATSRELDEVDVGMPDASDASPPLALLEATSDELQPLTKRLQLATDQLEAQILTQTLAQCSGNKAAAARTLRIDYTTLHRKLKRHGIAST